jgi:hypothetical protein
VACPCSSRGETRGEEEEEEGEEEGPWRQKKDSGTQAAKYENAGSMSPGNHNSRPI